MNNKSETQDLREETSELAKIVKRGFILWSWIGLIGAYTATSAVYANQLYIIAIQGTETLGIYPFASMMMAALLLPMGFLAIGWLIFYRYSICILRIALLPEKSDLKGSKIEKEFDKLPFFFKFSILSLIISWIAILLAVFVPYVALISWY